MRKKQLFIITALALTCLSGCHKDKPVESQAPLETIQPDTTSETISDKLDDQADTLEIHGLAIDPDGKVLRMIQECAKRYAAHGSVAAGTRGRVT